MKFNKQIFKLIIIFLLFISTIKPCYAIKIGLYDTIMQGYSAISNNGLLMDDNSHRVIYNLKPMTKYNLVRYKSNIAIQINGKYYDLGSNRVVFQPGDNGFVSTKNRWYRGKMLVINNGSGLTFINDISLEDYLLGVVPSEMPSNWNLEAQKAQAIAARSYAIANMGKRANHGYDLMDTPDDQAYGGASSETKKTNAAVSETKGMVLTCNSKIISAYYHASSGGHTLNSSQVWNRDLPYIHSVAAYDENIPKKGHGVGMSQYGANKLASQGYDAFQILGYFYTNVSLNTVNTGL